MSAERLDRASSPECPTTRELQSWLDGVELPEAVVKHLADCQRCQHSLALLTEDEDLRALARAKPTGTASQFLDEPEYSALRSRLLRWTQDDVTTKVDEANSVHSISTQRSAEPKRSEDGPSLRETLSVDSLKRRLPTDRYLVDRLIAEGGAGAVYLAFDQRLKREVAIKVLFNNSLKDRQRFQREARLLAEFEHPNIVKVFDFGTLSSDVNTAEDALQSGQCYLVMEYVSGGTASRIGIDQPEWASGELNYPRLAELLATAADGLAAAHSRNLVHRDVKPGNLLLTVDRSALKVADFGIARLVDLDATQFTRTGDLLGTPVFMSPEQVTVSGDVTRASDIYSLGATLYQLMTGVAPYQGGPAAVLRQIAESSPVSPRLIVPKIPEDLETICLYAMQSEPSARYATMEAFAADLRSFSLGEPIVARPISSTTRAIRFLRRNKSFTGVLAVCAGLICLLTIGSAAAAIIFRTQNQQLKIAAEGERSAKLAAEGALKASITAADELLLAVTTETEFLPRAPGSQEVTRKLLERARDYFRSFIESNQNNASLTYQLARAHAGLGQVAMRVGDTATLERETETALALIEQIPDGQIDPAERAALRSDTLVVLANHLTEAGEAKRSLPMLEEATAICKDALRDIPNDDELRSSYATSLFGLANAMAWLGKREEALPNLKAARELFGELRREYPKQATFLRSAAACDVTLATIALDLNQAAVGKGHLLDALSLLNQVADDDLISLRIREIKIKVLTNLALAERRMGNNIEAKARYEAVITEAQRLIDLEPGVPSHPWNLVVASMNSGGPEMELGNLGPLIDRWQATLPVLEKLIVADPENQRYQQVKAMLQSNIAIILRDMGKLDEAIAPLKAATETLQSQAEKLDYASESYLPVALNHYELASTFIQLERWQEAIKSLDDSDAIVAKILLKDQAFTPARGHLLDSLHARVQLLLKSMSFQPDELRSLTKRSLELARELAGANSDVAEYQLELPRALNDLAQSELEFQQFPAALQAVNESRKLLDAFQANLDALPDQQPPTSEFRSCRKVALLVEARCLQVELEKTEDDKRRLALSKLIEEARLYGATDEELANF